MSSALRVNPAFVMYLKKTLTICGRNQRASQSGLLEAEKMLHENHVAEIPIDPKKNKAVLEHYRKTFGMPDASDIKILNEVATRRVKDCIKKEEDPRSLKALSNGHKIDAYQPEHSELVHIRILAK
jgi:hypothetical protein